MKKGIVVLGMLFIGVAAFGQTEETPKFKVSKIEKKIYQEKKAEPVQAEGEMKEEVVEPKQREKEQAPKKMETNFARPE
jgi:hypothetical protein